MTYNTLLFEIKENIGILRINRPNSMNALNSEFFREAGSVFDELEKSGEISVLIITGEGKAFAAGADIAEMADLTPEMGRQISAAGQKFFNRIELCPWPVIAAVNGFALGGGCELALACDFRIASEKAKFGQPEANLGMIPGFAGTQRLPRLVGLGNALYLLFTASVINAEEALRIGLVQNIVQPDWIMDESFAIAKQIASKGPAAIRKIKQVTRQGLNMNFYEACELETREFGSLFKNEGEEGMKAFLEKRNPNWK